MRVPHNIITKPFQFSDSSRKYFSYYGIDLPEDPNQIELAQEDVDYMSQIVMTKNPPLEIKIEYQVFLRTQSSCEGLLELRKQLVDVLMKRYKSNNN